MYYCSCPQGVHHTLGTSQRWCMTHMSSCNHQSMGQQLTADHSLKLLLNLFMAVGTSTLGETENVELF